MSEDTKKLTTFLIRFDIFQCLVMPFSLFNDPASWEYFINNILFNFLYSFV